MKCVICGKELYGASSKTDRCRSCLLESLPDRVCLVCGKTLSKEQVRQNCRYCSRKCFGESDQAKSAGVEMCRRNREDTPWWNYKNFVRHKDNDREYSFIYLVEHEDYLKVGVTGYYPKRIEEVTRGYTPRGDINITVYRMKTLDCTYLEHYIHSLFEHESEYHNVEDLLPIKNALNNPKSFIRLNSLKDDRNPDLEYRSSLEFYGNYRDLEEVFKERTGEINLSMWTAISEHRDLFYSDKEIESVDPDEFDDSRLFELEDGMITHNCRLMLDLRELRRKNGGLFGSGDSTGSIGVVTLNLPRIAYEARHKGGDNLQKAKDIFYTTLDYYAEIARDSLLIKREFLEENILNKHLIPAFSEYVGTLDNHFNTIGIIGMNEMCENLLGVGITDTRGHAFSIEVLDHLRDKLSDFQEETEQLFNLEATPAEATSYRLAKRDKELYPDIVTQGTSEAPYYTNSCHIPVKDITSIKETFDHQEDLQVKFTGGTVIHLMCAGPISAKQAKSIIRTVCTNYKVPYVSISPLIAICAEHGHLLRSSEVCPICNKPTKLMQRITGYVRDIKNWNPGKAQEFKERRQLII